MSNKKVQQSLFVRALGFVINKVWLLFAFSIISLATIFLLLELLLPEVNRFKADIVNWIENKYQIDINVDSISSKWSSSGPSISLINFSLLSDDKKFNIFEVGSLSIEFDILASILNREYSTHAIHLQNANIRFYIDSKLGVKLNTFSNINTRTEDDLINRGEIEETSKRFFELLVAQKKIEIRNSNLELMTLSGDRFNYPIEELSVKKYEDNHQLIGRLRHISTAENNSSSIAVIAEVFRGVEENDNYTNLYLDVDEIDLASLPKIGNFFEKNNVNEVETSPVVNDLGVIENSSNSIASLDMWARWQNRHWQKMDAQLNIKGEKNLSATLSWDNKDYHHGYAEIHHLIFSETIEKVLASNVEDDDNSNANSDVDADAGLDTDDGLAKSIYFKYLHEEKENISWNLIVNKLNLAPIFDYLPAILSENVNGISWLKNNEASMLLEHFHVEINKNKSTWSEPRLTLSFSDLKMKSQHNLPIFSELSGWLSYDFNRELIQAEVESLSGDLMIKDLFRENIPVDKFGAKIMSDLSHGFQRLKVTDLIFENADIALAANAMFYYDDGEPNLSLYANITRGNAANTHRYLPTGIMSDSLVNYLDTSIKSGKLFATHALLRGPLKEFPYPNNSGVFAVLAEVENADYQFLADWPLVKEAKATLLFEGNGMHITADSAISLGNRLDLAKVSIDDMSAEYSMLDLSMEIKSSDNQGKTYLKQTPLDFISDGLSSLDLTGDIRTNIELKIPLFDEPKMLNAQSNKQSDQKVPQPHIIINGSVHPLNHLNLKLPFVSVDAISGTLSFNENGIIESRMSGQVDGKRVNATIATIDEYDDINKEHSFMKIDLDGIFATSAIDPFLSGHWSSFLSGEAMFIGEVLFLDRESNRSISNQHSDVSIKNNALQNSGLSSVIKVNFESNLQGVSVKMPDFLEKEKERSELFELNLEFLKPKSALEPSDAQLGSVVWNEIRTEWLIETNKDTAQGVAETSYSVFAEINADKTLINSEDVDVVDIVKPKWNYPSGITLEGRLDKINLLPWVSFIEQIKANYRVIDDENNLEDSKAKLNLKGNSQPETFDWLVNKMNLSVNQLSIPGLEPLTELEVAVDKYLDIPWRLSVKTKQGNMDVIFDEKSPWLIDADNIDLTFVDTVIEEPVIEEPVIEKTGATEDKKIKDDSEEHKLAYEQAKRHFDIHSNLIDLDINCNICQFNKKNLGNFRASIRKKSNSNGDINLSAKIDKGLEHQLVLNAIWSMDDSELDEKTYSEKAYAENTQLNFSLNTDNVGKLLKSWGIQPSIEDSKGNVSGSLDWDNSPWRIDYKKLNGFGRLDFGKGYLSQISDADGRIIALFNLKSILRKLTFDFKDVYKKGFFYDSMGGTVKIDNGIISTYDTSIKGNVADVWLYGITDLNNETVEQHAIVSPHITSSVPVLAAWALEPTTGIILYLLNKLMEPAIDVATQIDYRVHGSFDKPIVDEIKKSRKRVKIKFEEDQSSEMKSSEKNPSKKASNKNKSGNTIPKENVNTESDINENIDNDKVYDKSAKEKVLKLEQDINMASDVKNEGDNNG